MTVPTEGQLLKLTLRAGGPATGGGMNIRHYRTSVVAGPGRSLTQLLLAWTTAAIPPYVALLNTGWTLLSSTITIIDVSAGTPLAATEELFITSGGGGTITGDALPSQTTGVITLRTGQAGRARRGRVYVMGPSESHSTSTGQPSSTYVTLLVTLGDFFNAIVNDFGSGSSTNMVPVVWSFHTGDYADILSIVARNKWGTQRKRNTPP